MSMKLLPAALNPADAAPLSDGSNSLVPLAQRAISVPGRQGSVVPSADAFTWSSRGQADRTRAGAGNWIDATTIDATPVEDSESGAAAGTAVEYVSGWGWGSPTERTAIAHYLFYAAGQADRRGQLVDLYA